MLQNNKMSSEEEKRSPPLQTPDHVTSFSDDCFSALLQDRNNIQHKNIKWSFCCLFPLQPFFPHIFLICVDMPRSNCPGQNDDGEDLDYVDRLSMYGSVSTFLFNFPGVTWGSHFSCCWSASS